MRDEVRPKRVLVNGKLRDVAEFAHVQPRAQPVTTCPVCQRTVILTPREPFALSLITGHHEQLMVQLITQVEIRATKG